MKYPLSNYAIRVDNVLARVIHIVDDNSMKPSEEDGRVRLQLNDTTLPGVTLDGSFALTISACNNITCRKSNITTFSKYILPRACRVLTLGNNNILWSVYGFCPSYVSDS